MKSADQAASARQGSRPGSRPGPRRALVLGAVLVSLTAGACDSTTHASQPSSNQGGTAGDPARSQARLTITPAHRSTDVDPSAGISVKVSDGTLTNVTAE